MAERDEDGLMAVFIEENRIVRLKYCAPTTDVKSIIDTFHDYLPLPPVHKVWIFAIRARRVYIFQRERDCNAVAALRSFFADAATNFRPFCHESDDKETLRDLVRHYGRIDNPVVAFYDEKVVMPVVPEKERWMTVNFETPRGKTFALDMMPSDTIMDLKKRVEDVMEGVSPAQQLFFIASRLLDDDNRTLSSYNIKSGSMIEMQIRPIASIIGEAVRAEKSM